MTLTSFWFLKSLFCRNSWVIKNISVVRISVKSWNFRLEIFIICNCKCLFCAIWVSLCQRWPLFDSWNYFEVLLIRSRRTLQLNVVFLRIIAVFFFNFFADLENIIGRFRILVLINFWIMLSNVTKCGFIHWLKLRPYIFYNTTSNFKKSWLFFTIFLISRFLHCLKNHFLFCSLMLFLSFWIRKKGISKR